MCPEASDGCVDWPMRCSLKPLGQRLSHSLVVALSSKTDDPMEMFGANKLISPVEIVHALFLKTESEIEAGATEETLGAFRRCFRSVTLRFQLFASDESLHFAVVNLRDQFLAISAEIERTVQQRIYEVVDFKATRESELKETVSVKTVQEMYEKQCDHASKKDITASFIEQAITVHKNMLSIPFCRKTCLLLLEIPSCVSLSGIRY